MRLNDDGYVLELPVVLGGQSFPVNLSLVVDAAMGPTLVDTGVPGLEEAIAAAMAEAGVGIEDLRRIVLTHQDIDHVGSLHALAQASGARVLAHEVEAPFIDGSQQPRFARPEVLERGPEFRPVVESLRPTPVDHTLTDGERLDLAGGVRVVSTPGHTPGHQCLYLERSRTLIAGDALLAHGGCLHRPSPDFTMDLATAHESVLKLAELDVRAIVCYHGGVVDDDTNGQLRRLAAAVGVAAGRRGDTGRTRQRPPACLDWFYRSTTNGLPQPETAKVHPLDGCYLRHPAHELVRPNSNLVALDASSHSVPAH